MASLIRPRSPNIVRRSKSKIFALRRDPVERLAPEGWKGRPRGWTGPWTTGAASALGLGLWFLASLPAGAQTPAEELDALWADVCEAALTGDTGTSFEDRCEEIIEAGPGSGARRSGAAIGNNLGVSAAQGRASNQAASITERNVSERLEKLKGEEESGSSADWAVGRLGVFASIGPAWSDRDATVFENAYDAHTLSITGGADYLLSDAAVVGLAFTYLNTDTDFAAGAGNLDLDTYSLTAFASLAPPAGNFYFDVYAGYGWLDYSSTRNISFFLATPAPGFTVTSTATGNTDGDQILAGAAAGYDFVSGAVTIGPRVKVDYSRTEVDAYTETDTAGLALAYGEQTIRTFSGVVGILASRAISTDFGVVLPQLRADYVHEFDDDARSIPASFALDPAGTPITIRTEPPDRDYFRLGLSLTAVLPNGVIPFLDYEGQFGHSFLDSHALIAGLRLEF